MKLALRLLVAAALLASAGYSLLRLRDLAAAKRLLSEPGSSPEAVLARLAQDDRSGAVRALVEAQLEQSRRLSSLPGEGGGGAVAAPPEPAEPLSADSRGQRLFTAGGPPGGRGGTGVLIDLKTGERLTAGARGARPGPAEPRGSGNRSFRPPATLRGFLSDDLTARRDRAYAVLLGTAAVAVFLVARARRVLGP